ncbi:hypothetical protein [Fictibacillus phosphorivorans]|uniref:hypothetical protein n=1 Tax=Fictibacillus phosphorivorans TaxID=1221500 RepID=UPI0016427EC0|nr:hypothetical protein [Fictibacillus phosphorivorans]
MRYQRGKVERKAQHSLRRKQPLSSLSKEVLSKDLEEHIYMLQKTERIKIKETVNDESRGYPFY